MTCGSIGRMSDLLHRQWLMLKNIPRAPRRVSSRELRDVLRSNGHDIDVRSIQRDLHKLTAHFALEHDENRPIGWWFAKDAPDLTVPSLDVNAALTLVLVERHLVNQLPRVTLDALAPQFEAARRLLSSQRARKVAAWKDKVRVIPRGQATLPPAVDARVLVAVYDAVLGERRLRVTYSARGKSAASREVHPLAVVYREGIAYCVCTHEGYDDVRALALHRMSDAEMRPEPRKRPREFDLDRFIEDGELAFRIGKKKIALRALFDDEVAASVLDTPLGDDQRATSTADGRVQLDVTVEDTRVLRSFLLGFGPHCEVVRPRALRDAMRDDARAMAKRYA